MSREIRDFQSIKKLLKSLRDAIKTHRFLYLMSNILHRNISENNIIITDSKKANDFTSMLIDLNLVKKIDSERSNARHQTDIMKFMMIQVLRNVSHIYRHDLESFFYVLLWICNRRAWNIFESWFEERLKQSRLTKWYIDSYDDIADAKVGHMHVDEFKDILKKFLQTLDCIKSLCEEIREILFSLTKDEELNIETQSNSEKLYESIIKIFNEAIADVRTREKWGHSRWNCSESVLWSS